MNERIVILGAGESGTGAAILAKSKGYAVFVSDQGVIKDQYKKELQEHVIDFEEGVVVHIREVCLETSSFGPPARE